MPNSARYALPYPAPSDQPNGPSQLAALATAIENLWCNAHVYMDADYAFPSDGFDYLVPLVSTQGFLNGGAALATGYRLSVSKTGTYRVAISGRFTRSAASAAAFAAAKYNLAVRKNSGGSISGGTALLGAWTHAPADINVSNSRLVALTAGDYLELFATGLSGSTLKGSSLPYNTYLSVDRVL